VDEDGLCWGKNPQTRQPVRLLGDGYRMLLGLVLDILYQLDRFKPGRLLEEVRGWSAADDASLAVKTSGVVVIDEPENHLHPVMQQRIGFWLKRHFPNFQFIVTTHSALICQAADRGGLFRMSGPGRIEALDEETWEAALLEMAI
jgi:predicted ATPase